MPGPILGFYSPELAAAQVQAAQKPPPPLEPKLPLIQALNHKSPI